MLFNLGCYSFITVSYYIIKELNRRDINDKEEIFKFTLSSEVNLADYLHFIEYDNFW